MCQGLREVSFQRKKRRRKSNFGPRQRRIPFDSGSNSRKHRPPLLFFLPKKPSRINLRRCLFPQERRRSSAINPSRGSRSVDLGGAANPKWLISFQLGLVRGNCAISFFASVLSRCFERSRRNPALPPPNMQTLYSWDGLDSFNPFRKLERSFVQSLL